MIRYKENLKIPKGNGNIAIIFFNRTIEHTQAAKALSDFDLL